MGYRQGQEVCRDAQETTGAPAALRLKLERDGVQADGEDIAILTCDCVDEQGRHVPTAAPFVHFYTNEKGSILGTGSDVCDHVPVTCPDRQMRAFLLYTSPYWHFPVHLSVCVYTVLSVSHGPGPGISAGRIRPVW